MYLFVGCLVGLLVTEHGHLSNDYTTEQNFVLSWLTTSCTKIVKDGWSFWVPLSSMKAGSGLVYFENTIWLHFSWAGAIVENYIEKLENGQREKQSVSAVNTA